MKKVNFLFVLITIPFLPIAAVILFFTTIATKLFNTKSRPDEGDHMDDDFSACIKD
jgi:hypothetical protein